MSKQVSHLYEFGPFRIDVGERMLLREGEAVPLTPKAFETLLLLVESAGHTVEKDELMRRLWPDTFVEEANLANNISLLRKALDEGSNGREYIKTVPRRGYRFVGDVKTIAVGGAAAPSCVTADHGQQLDQTCPRFGSPYWQLLTACVVLICIGIAAIYAVKQGQRTEPHAVARVRSIAVLPFKPLVAASHDEVLELGIADALISRLSSIKEITVQPVSAVRKYTNLEQDTVAIGKTLGVEGILDSSIQIVEGKIRVRSQLVRVSDGRQLWRFECDDRCAGILEVEDSISERIASALALTLTAEESAALTRRYTSDTDTYNLYLKGRFFWNKRTENDVKKAVDYFQQVIAREPKYAPAYSGLADCSFVLVGIHNYSAREEMPKARDAATKAIEIDDTLGEAHASLGRVKMSYDFDFKGAEKEFKRSIDLNPNYATAHAWYGFYLTAVGHHDEAIREATRAVELEPASPIIYACLGTNLYLARRYDEALETWRKTRELDPNWPTTISTYVFDSYVQKGMYQEGVTQILDSLKRNGAGKRVVEDLKSAYERRGIRGVFQKAIALDPNGTQVADYYAFLGEKDKTFAALEKKYDERFGYVAFLKCIPYYDSLRSDPRFADLVRRIGLPQ